MRRVVLRGPRALCLALGVVSIVGVMGCQEVPEERALASPTDLQQAEVETLIREHADFSRLITVEVMSAVESPTGRHLIADGYLQVTDQEPARAVLTPKGRTSGLVEFVFEYGKPYYVVPVARRELIEITSVEAWPRKVPAKRAAFSYRRSPVDAGRDLLDAGSQLSELGSGGVFAGSATLVLHDDGWKVHSLML
jgi:hypothetical protein